MDNDKRNIDNAWQPIRRGRAAAAQNAQPAAEDTSGDESTGNTVLTKVANLLDDVTEQKHAANVTYHENTGTKGAELPPPKSVTPHRAPTRKPAVPKDHQGKDSPLQQTSSGLNSLSPGDQGAISIKGRSDGIAIEIGTGDWSTLVAQLDTRLEQAANFFRGGEVALNVGVRQLDERDLDSVRKVFHKYGLSLNLLRTASERTFEAAVNLGLSAALEGIDRADHVEAVSAASNLAGQRFFVFRGNLRSGQVLRKSESIVIIGDVNPGAQVVSTGDVLVWGRLRGVAHAGAEGNTQAIVCAMALEPTQLRIGSFIAVSPEQGRNNREQPNRDVPKTAEIAYIQDGALVVRPWNEAKRGFRSVFLK